MDVEEARKDEGDDGHELHDYKKEADSKNIKNAKDILTDVDRGPRGILHGVTRDGRKSHKKRKRLMNEPDGVSNDSGLVGRGLLASIVAFLDILHTGVQSEADVLEEESGQYLLSIVPSTAGVGHADGNLDARHERSSKESGEAVLAEQESDNERGEDNKGAGGDHLLERGIGGDGDTALVVGLGLALHNSAGWSRGKK